MKYTYAIEAYYNDKWTVIVQDTRDFCLGYLSRARYSSPRNAYRLVRSDGKVMYESPAYTEVSVGQVAGYPTPEQYEAAAKRALEQADSIRKKQGNPRNLAPLEVCADELTQRKTRDIMHRGYRITGFILLSENGKESCLIDRSAVRWLDEKEWWTLMHPPCTSEPLRLTYDLTNVKDVPRPTKT